jgi:hypothetical protein
MRWAAVVSLTLAVGSACGGRSEYFDDYGGSVAGEAGDDSGGGSGRGGASGKGGVSGKGGAPRGGNSPTGGVAGTGGTFSTGGVGVTGGAFPTGGRGGTSTGGIGGVVAGGAFPTGGTPAGGVSGMGGSIGGRGGTGTGGVAGTIIVGGTGGSATGGRGGTNTGGTGGVTPEDCLECISSSCPEATACFQNPTCVEGLICGASVCVGLEGAPALRCWTTCFGGDARLALQALTAAICLAQNCSMACQGF